MEIVHSEYVSPCSPIVLKRWGHDLKQDPEGEHEAQFVRHIFKRLPTLLRTTRDPQNLAVAGPNTTEFPLKSDNPYHKSCRFPKLFGDFPRTIIVCGDAERLVREVRSLATAMDADGVDLRVHWARDACHDPLMLNEFWWDKSVLNEIWEAIASWANGFDDEAPYTDESSANSKSKVPQV